MAGYLLDTNHLSAAIRRVSPVRDRIRRTIRDGVRVGTTMPVLCELEAAIHQTNRPEACRRTLDRLLQEVRLWPVDREVARRFGETHVELRRLGVPFIVADSPINCVIDRSDLAMQALRCVTARAERAIDRSGSAIEGSLCAVAWSHCVIVW